MGKNIQSWKQKYEVWIWVHNFFLISYKQKIRMMLSAEYIILVSKNYIFFNFSPITMWNVHDNRLKKKWKIFLIQQYDYLMEPLPREISPTNWCQDIEPSRYQTLNPICHNTHYTKHYSSNYNDLFALDWLHNSL